MVQDDAGEYPRCESSVLPLALLLSITMAWGATASAHALVGNRQVTFPRPFARSSHRGPTAGSRSLGAKR